jgi:hypothetical protein
LLDLSLQYLLGLDIEDVDAYFGRPHSRFIVNFGIIWQDIPDIPDRHHLICYSFIQRELFRDDGTPVP